LSIIIVKFYILPTGIKLSHATDIECNLILFKYYFRVRHPYVTPLTGSPTVSSILFL